MLLSQGWTPGTYLGPVNAPHAHLHSNASSSPIRIALRDDNLGLGAKRGSGQTAGECTGLDAFQGLLGRLNGKGDTELKKEQKCRDDLKRATYTERRWGILKFVSGGALVGDRIRELADEEKLRVAGHPHQLKSVEKPKQKENLLTHGFEATSNSTIPADHTGKSTSLKHADAAFINPDSEVSEPRPIVQRKEVSDTEEMDHPKIDTLLSDKARRKAAKLKRRLDRRKRKEVRKATRSRTIQLASPSSTTPARLSKAQDPEEDVGQDSTSATVTLPPTLSVTAVPAGARHVIRQRYIRQKKMAIMDPKALNEVSLGGEIL